MTEEESSINSIKFVKKFMETMKVFFTLPENEKKITCQLKLLLWSYFRMVCEKLPFSNSNEEKFTKLDFLLMLSPMGDKIIVNF